VTSDLTARDRYAQLKWIGDKEVEIEGVPIEFSWDFLGRPDDRRLMVLKHPDFIKDYMEVIGGRSYRNILELGIFDGGSCILFAHLFGAKRLAALDMIDKSPRFDGFRAKSPIGPRIGVHYSTSQDDEAKLTRILETEFDGPPDLIIDDASHYLDESTRSFEILFARLAPGGWYVLEDWSWAHFPLGSVWPDKDSLAHLTFRLLLAWVARPDIIANVVVKRHMMFIQKAAGASVEKHMSLDGIIAMHGRMMKPF
jgi:cephalosporin hydroxylase